MTEEGDQKALTEKALEAGETTKDIDKDSSSTATEDETARGYWGNQIDFILSCIGYAVGLGNLWRFPYLCMRNGGGAFLIPYFTFLVLCGMPLFFMELAVGQFTSLSPLSMWNIAPLFKGLGWGMVIVSGLLCIYYNIIITWCLYYLWRSFTTRLPWAAKPDEKIYNCTGLTVANATSLPSYFISDVESPNTSNYTNVSCETTTIVRASQAEVFWHEDVLSISSGLEELGTIRWPLLICLLLAWLIVFGCLCKGVKSSGKVVYVTAVVPYIFLTILLIRGVTLDGAVDGIIFYLRPDFKKLMHFQVWCEACLQIFYSLGPAWGGLITMASYNKFNNNCYRDALLVPVVNCGTSFYGGFVIFSVIGHMAKITGKPVDKVVTQGPGLAFVVYPEAITKLPISPMWAIFFFLMLLTLGLDSQFATFETCISSFVDEWPKYLRKRKLVFTIFCCIVEFFIGLLYITNAGMYFFQITDWYCAAFSIMVIAFFECMVVSWMYGYNRLYDEIEMMIGYKPCAWWKICWGFITPLLLLLVIGFSLGTMTAPTYGTYRYPGWAIGFGWCLASLSMMPLPLVAAYRLYHCPGTIYERIRKLTQPTPDWGPAEPKYKEMYKYRHYDQNGGYVSEEMAAIKS